jgi:phosphoenolpyruvate carboxylase
MSTLNRNAPEYRIRRETLNQLRRELKAEIEGIWQSDQMRRDSINVQNEAKRITERYKVIFKAFPTFVKFIKHLAIEAFWRFQASKYYAQSPEWKETFLKTYKPQGSIFNILTKPYQTRYQRK